MIEDTHRNQTGRTVVVEFSISDSSYPFVSATEQADCVCELAEMLPRDGGRYAEFFNVTGAPPGRIADFAAAHERLDATLLKGYDDGGLFEFLVAGNCPAFTLAEHGALPQEAVSADGEGRIVAEIPPQYAPADVIDPFLDENPGASIVSKRRKDSFPTLFTRSAGPQILHTHLTDRQREVVQAAYELGYYEWPRETTGEDVAAELGVSSATFSEHVRAAERKLFTLLLEGRADEALPR